MTNSNSQFAYHKFTLSDTKFYCIGIDVDDEKIAPIQLIHICYLINKKPFCRQDHRIWGTYKIDRHKDTLDKITCQECKNIYSLDRRGHY